MQTGCDRVQASYRRFTVTPYIYPRKATESRTGAHKTQKQAITIHHVMTLGAFPLTSE